MTKLLAYLWTLLLIMGVDKLVEVEGTRSIPTTAIAIREIHPYPRRTFYSEMDNRRELTLLKTCDGEENFKSDIGIASYMLSLISSTAGLFSLTELSVPSNNISILSTIISLIFWVPSAILTFFAWSDPLSWATGNLVNIGSLLITLYGGLGIITGTADLIVSATDEVLGITALILGTLTTFPETYDDVKEVVQEWLGKEVVDNFLRQYGCGLSQTEFGFFGNELI